MASLVWLPVATNLPGVVEVRQAGVLYSIAPGVPIDIPIEHYPAVVAALAATGAPLVTGPAPTVLSRGVLGAAPYSYKVAAHNANGPSIPSAAGATANGNAALSAANNNLVTWPDVPGATGFDVIRFSGGASQGFIGYVADPILQFVDSGQVASAYVPAVANVSQVAVLPGPVEI